MSNALDYRLEKNELEFHKMCKYLDRALMRLRTYEENQRLKNLPNKNY